MLNLFELSFALVPCGAVRIVVVMKSDTGKARFTLLSLDINQLPEMAVVVRRIDNSVE